jgi:hypothetical protein
MVQESGNGFTPSQSRVRRSTSILEEMRGCLSFPLKLTHIFKMSFFVQVLAFFNQNDSNDDEGTGLALDFVIGNLRAEGISEKDVRAAVDFLANEGHLYSTIDDNHYKSTA